MRLIRQVLPLLFLYRNPGFEVELSYKKVQEVLT